MSAPAPRDEAERLARLRELGILDTAPEPAYDAAVRLAAMICGTPMALISLIDADRQWYKARVGVTATQTPRSVAFCTHALTGDTVLEVPDAAADARFASNPMVTSGLKVRYYAGAPLSDPRGSGYGTVCVMDTVPRRLDASQLEALRDVASLVVGQMRRGAAQRRLEEASEALQAGDARTAAGLVADARFLLGPA